MKRWRRTLVAACLAAACSLSLTGCDFIDNIFCDLLEMPLCGDDGNVALPGGTMGPQPRPATQVNEAHQ